MAKHTPGPWRVGDAGHTVFGPKTDAPAPVIVATMGKNEAFRANARLIALAPRMLEALESLYEHCAMIHKHWGDNSNAKEADAAIKAGKALLAEAKGGE